MKISKLEEMLKRAREEHGDLETTMVGTYLPEGFCQAGTIFRDVFETTVGSSYVREGGKFCSGQKRLMIQWQV